MKCRPIHHFGRRKKIDSFIRRISHNAVFDKCIKRSETVERWRKSRSLQIKQGLLTPDAICMETGWTNTRGCIHKFKDNDRSMSASTKSTQCYGTHNLYVQTRGSAYTCSKPSLWWYLYIDISIHLFLHLPFIQVRGCGYTLDHMRTKCDTFFLIISNGRCWNIELDVLDTKNQTSSVSYCLIEDEFE